MHVDGARTSLNCHMRSNWRHLRAGCEADHRPLEDGFPAQIVRNVGLPYRRLFLLCAGKRSEKKSACKCSTAQTHSYIQFHYPSPRSRDSEESLWIAYPRRDRGPPRMYYCFDDYNAANGFRERAILFNRTTLSLLRRQSGQTPHPKMQTRLGQKSFAAFTNSHLNLACTSLPVPQSEFPSSPN
jgi:hypothetical protein